jgi:hypothetical protein
VKKIVIAAAVVTVPLLAIGIRELSRLFAGLADPTKSSPASILWIFTILFVLAFLWIAVFAVSKRVGPPADRLPFAAAAAIAMREAKKRPPTEMCGKCGRPRISDSVSKCLYCGAEIGA